MAARTYELIRRVPGFGSVSAAYPTPLIIDIERFRNRNAFTAYFGIVPKMRESADISTIVQRPIGAMEVPVLS